MFIAVWKTIRYVLDCAMLRLESHCPYDWNDEHSFCRRCWRVWFRKMRIREWEGLRDFPKARLR